MELQAVRCLRCGEHHQLARLSWRYLQECECPRCGYLGWAALAEGKRTAGPAGRRLLAMTRLRVV